FHAHVDITALRDEAGQLRGFAHVTRNITERVATQHALQQSEEAFRHVVDSVTDYGIYRLDTVGRVTLWNSGAARLMGYTEEEIIGQPLARFYTPEDWHQRKPQD